MTTRRTALLSLSSLAMAGLAGCDRWRSFFQPDVIRTGIDVHAHVFNGRDVPVVGFLQQAIIRDPHEPVNPAIVSDALLKLLKTIMLVRTPTAEAELASLRGRSRPTPQADVVAQDEANVAEGIARFSAGLQPPAAGLSTTADNEAQILQTIADELGRPDVRSALQTPQAQGRELAAALYQSEDPAGLARVGPRWYRHRSQLAQTLRWAGLLTRSRLDITAELDRLYGGPTLIRVFSPSLVDFGSWFLTEEQVTPIEQQIEVISAVAQRFESSLILPFAPFCPLRAALEREDDPGVDPLRHLKFAVAERGFAGVKLYPPMGFRPIGNDHAITWAPRVPAGGAAALDRELNDLYVWCVENQVPIKAHANNSIAAGDNSGRFADPDGWRAVLEQPGFQELRLNLAHFGGFDETAPEGRLRASPGDWEETLVEMLDDAPNLYFDLSYWTDVVEADDPGRSRIMQRTRALIDRSPLVRERMMYGSDWSMIGRVPDHPAYLAGVQAALSELLPDEDDRARIMGGNAARFLGLDEDGPQRTRLFAAYANHPVFQEIFT